VPDDPDPTEADRRARLVADIAIQAGDWPPLEDLETLVADCAAAVITFVELDEEAGVAIAFADDAAVASLNAQWRDQAKPTNVLSFPAAENAPSLPDGAMMLGDVILADGVVRHEAHEMGLPLDHHIRHLVVHGLLHLLGFDHESDADAEEMEELETDILAMMGVPDPHAAPLVSAS
jgi:probable rRNA maturation factor